MDRSEPFTEPPPPPHAPSKLVRLSVKILRRGPSLPVRRWRIRSLRGAYLRGQSDPRRELPPEAADPALVDDGERLRRGLIDSHAGKHRGKGYRVLMLRPGSITAEIWFEGLRCCMQHGGVDCRVVPPTADTQEINEAIEAFAPNVLIATEAAPTLHALDFKFLYDYKRRHGCLRLFVPVWHSGMKGGYSTPRQDAWRFRLRRQGWTADAYFSIFEPEFYARFARDHDGPSVDYITVAQACNPFVDWPLPLPKRHDYFMATSLSDDRLEVTRHFVQPIMRRYRGEWAGPRWGFGLERIAPDEMPKHYAAARIALSPLAGFVPIHAAELTHRVYAAAGSGAFQLTMPTAVTERYFTPDELVQAATPEEFLRLFEHYVDRPDERNAVARNALRRAYGNHTCFHRVDQLVSHWDQWRRRGLF